MQNSCMCSRESCVLHFVAASTKGAKGMDIILYVGGWGVLQLIGTKGSLLQAV